MSQERYYLEFSDSKSHKFYEVVVDGSVVRTRYGKVGAKGRSQEKVCGSWEDALEEASSKAQAKIKKGYVEIPSEAPEDEGSQELPEYPTQHKEGGQAPVVWRLQTGDSAFGVCADEQGVWVGNEGGRVCRLSVDGELGLQFQLPRGVKCIVADDAWLYAGCNDGRVYDISGKTPMVAYEIEGGVDVHWMDIYDGTLAIADALGKVSAFNHEGELLWSRGEERTSGWMLRCDAGGVYHGHTKGVAMYGWDQGELLWKQPLTRSVQFGWQEEHAVYAATSGAKIHMFSKAGEEWVVYRCDASVFSCTAAYEGGLVFAGDNASGIYCFGERGERLWKLKTDCGAAQSMHLWGHQLYIVTTLGFLAAIDIRPEAIAEAFAGQIPQSQDIDAPEAPALPIHERPALQRIESDAQEEGVLVECYAHGSKLRVRPLSEGYEAGWNVQFPRDLREEGARFLVEELRPAARGGFYRALGEIKRVG